MEPDSESVMLEPNLENLLNHALGSGEAAGAVNFITLKTILESILHKLNLTNDPPKSSIFDKSQSDVQNRLEKLGLVRKRQFIEWRKFSPILRFLQRF